jgi:hypothetical protein
VLDSYGGAAGRRTDTKAVVIIYAIPRSAVGSAVFSVSLGVL